MIVGNRLTLTVTGAGLFQLVGPNPRRVGVIFSRPSAGDYWITFGEPGGTNAGLNITTSMSQPWMILFDEPNDWITQPINLNCGAAMTVNAIELVDRQP